MKPFSAKPSSKPFFKSLLIVFVFLVTLTTVYAAGEVDAGFNASAYGLTNGQVRIIKRQPDGKILIGGNFFDINGFAATGIGRLNADLTVDTTFLAPDFGNGTGPGGTIYAIALQSDGKIIVGGDFFGVDRVFTPGLKRLLPNGTLDSTFQAPIVQFVSYGDIDILPGDKFLANGQRFNADGTVDNSFTQISGATETAVQPDGKILAVTGGSNSVYGRYNSDGSVDNTFATANANGLIFAIAVLPDGKSIIGGNFTMINGFQTGKIARINANGSLDLTFNQNLVGFTDTVADIKLTDAGKLAVVGNFNTYNGVANYRLVLLNTDGTRETSFQSPLLLTSPPANTLEILPDGRWLVGFNPITPVNTLMLFNTNGTLDTSFNVVVSRGGLVTGIAQQADGKILMVGSFLYSNGEVRRSIARLNTDGTLDTSFVPYFTSNFSFSTVAVQPDGKILVAGSVGPTLVRLNSDGSQDTSFNPGLPVQIAVNDIALQPDGKILLGGRVSTTSGTVRRVNADGSNDTTFTVPTFNGIVRSIALQADGKVMVGGAFTSLGANLRGRVARLNADGTLDSSFNPPGGANGEVAEVQLQADGKIVIAGEFNAVNGNNGFNKVAKFNPDGSLILDFQQSSPIDGAINALHVEPDGKVILGGSFALVGSTSKDGIAKFGTNGTLDSTFNTFVNFQGFAGVQDIYRQTDGKLVIGGGFTKVNGVSHVRIARLLNNAATTAKTPFDYDGDGKADISVFRPSENKWYILQSSNASLRENVFGLAGDVPVPADYDGDNKTDVAIWRPASGAWWYLSSVNGQQVNVNFGQTGDIPRPSDFDGDGKTDFVLYRPSNSVWYRLSATGQTAAPFAFGIAEDKPLIGDFDGDGKSEPAIFRPSTGDWWYAPSSSTNGQFAVVHWGASGDIPTPADVDADGKTDFMVYRPSNGGWYILRSGEQNYTILQFGTSEDKPVVADYDGDGKADVAVFRPSAGTWYLLQTTSGFGAVQWGNSSDIATPNSFTP